MRGEQYREWKASIPLLYSHLTTLPLPAHRSLTNARITCSASSSFKFEEFQVLAAGTNLQGGGLLTFSTLQLPLEEQLDDTRLRCQIKRTHQLRLQSQVNCLEECLMGSDEKRRFVALSEQQYPSVLLYQLEAIQKLDESTSINPRVTLTGHSRPLTVICSLKFSLLSADSGGEVLLHDINKGVHTQFRYHRESVTGCIWLGSQQDARTFATSCVDGTICVWDIRTSQPSYKIDSKHGEVKCLEGVKENWFLSGGSDCAVRFWDIRSSNSSKFFTYKQHSQPVTKLLSLGTHRKNPGFFISGASNGEVLVWQEEAEFVHLLHSDSIVAISQAISSSSTSPILTADCSPEPEIALWKPAIFNQYFAS